MKIDSIIFDMDGTLWDAVDSYVTIWNTTLDQEGIPHSPVTRDDLMRLMGSYLDDILAELVPHPHNRPAIMRRLVENESSMMATLGGHLYPHAKSVLASLSKQYRLFMVSNCGPRGLVNFVDFTGLRPYFTALLSHGMTGLPKAGNIQRLEQEYNLRCPVYVGDTQGDADQARIAGIPIIWAAYGFGHVRCPDAVINSLAQLPDALSKLNEHLQK